MKKILFIVIVMCAFANFSFSQIDTNDLDIYIAPNNFSDDEPLVWVEIMPEYPGGNDSLKKDIENEIIWPCGADVVGTVYLKCVIEKDGSVGDVQLLRGIEPMFDNEAIRVVKQLKKFKPGVQNGEIVRHSLNFCGLKFFSHKFLLICT